jgi:DNA repair protein RadC
MVTSFDNEGNMIACDNVASGDVSSVGVSVRDVVKTVLKRNAACVIISHNHTSGNALPSEADVEMTKSIKTTLQQMGVRLLDHIIVVDDDCVSMLQSRKYREIFI